MPEGSSTRIRWIGGIAIAAILLAAGMWPRLSRHERAVSVARAAETELPVVNAARAQMAPAATEVLLPGNTEAVNVARIFARANGYVQQRNADIGTVVKAGQVLAVISSPEVDQELAQARANVEQARAGMEQVKANLEQAKAAVVQAEATIGAAKANEEIAGTTNQRWERLVEKGVLPRQSGDERRSAYAARQAETAATSAALRTAQANVSAQEASVRAAQAAVNAQIANVRRLERLQAFERVTAPFNGVVTERNIEQGDLVTAGGAGAKNLFSVAQAQTLRIQVNVPQSYAVDIQPGQPAEVTVRERPGQVYKGAVARTATALDSTSRTLLVEVQLDNRNGSLLPGMYSQVKFALARSKPTIVIPADTLISDAKGSRVAIVSTGGALRFVTVQLGRDLGTQLEVLEGLKGNELLVTSPPDNLPEGQKVRVAERPRGDKL